MTLSLKPLLPLIGIATATLAGSVLPHDKIYGVNLGSWLVLEPWMLPQEWKEMGGQTCNDCSQCIATESAYAEAYPDTVDSAFEKHWDTWFSQDDVDKLSSYGINTVRIPLGYWIIEPLVDRRTEYYPRGGIKQLKRGLAQLKNAGISAILDHHALPGVQTPNQMFTGKCTNNVQFYTDYNYHRALVWTAVMTSISHLDPDFSLVFSIEAVNEPIMNSDQTPGYGNFQKNFVQTIRAVENSIGIGSGSAGSLSDLLRGTGNLTEALIEASSTEANNAVSKALVDAAHILVQVLAEMGTSYLLGGLGVPSRSPLMTMFMDAGWQNFNGANPAQAANGPQVYDNHLYYSFGGVADANPDAYLQSICNLNRVQNDAGVGNSPLIFGEWSLATQFGTSDSFRAKWADAQKMAYTKGAGWIFWSFKVEESTLAGDEAHSWSYFRGVENGMFTKDPSQYNNPNICKQYHSASRQNKDASSIDARAKLPSDGEHVVKSESIPASTILSDTIPKARSRNAPYHRMQKRYAF